MPPFANASGSAKVALEKPNTIENFKTQKYAPHDLHSTAQCLWFVLHIFHAVVENSKPMIKTGKFAAFKGFFGVRHFANFIEKVKTADKNMSTLRTKVNTFITSLKGNEVASIEKINQFKVFAEEAFTAINKELNSLNTLKDTLLENYKKEATKKAERTNEIAAREKLLEDFSDAQKRVGEANKQIDLAIKNFLKK